MKARVQTTTRQLAVLFAGLLLAAPFANADGKGFMVGAGGYFSTVDGKVDSGDPDRGDVKYDDNSFAYNLAVGWRFNKWLAIDAGYWDLGDYDSDKIDNQKFSLDGETWSVGGMVSVPLWIVDVYARGGVSWWEATSRAVDDDGTDPYYGIGGSFNIGGSLDLYAEWIRFDIGADVDTFGVGARFTF
jgi:hypothetical protein